MLYLIVFIVGAVFGWYVHKTFLVGEAEAAAPPVEIPGSLSVRCPKCKVTFKFGTHLWCSVRETPSTDAKDASSN